MINPQKYAEHIELFYGLSGLPVRLSSLGYRLHGRLPEYRYLPICIENIKIVYLINNNFFVNKLTIIYKLLQESLKFSL